MKRTIAETETKPNKAPRKTPAKAWNVAEDVNAIFQRKAELEETGATNVEIEKVIKKEWVQKAKEKTIGATESQARTYIPKILKGELKPKTLTAGVAKAVYVSIYFIKRKFFFVVAK